MLLETNDARMEMLKKYCGTIHIEGAYEDEIVVRIRFATSKIAENVYSRLVDAVEDENDGRKNNP